MVSRLIEVLESFQPRELVRFDDQARSYYSGIRWSKVPRLRGGGEPDGERPSMRDRLLHRGEPGAAPSDASGELWDALALVSGDGHQREHAIRVARLRPLVVRLLVLRCIDWVPEVRTAALDRLDQCPLRRLVDALPLAEQLAAERARGEILSAFMDTRFSEEDLRQAYRSPDARTRRAAWRRLRARGAATPSELLDVATNDEDVVVRGIAAGALEELSIEPRRKSGGVACYRPGRIRGGACAGCSCQAGRHTADLGGADWPESCSAQGGPRLGLAPRCRCARRVPRAPRG